MGKYKIEVKKSVYKDIRKIPKKDLRKILQKIESLSLEPRPSTCEKLTNQEKYRIRQGDYRILYEISDRIITIVIVKIRYRKNAYK